MSAVPESAGRAAAVARTASRRGAGGCSTMARLLEAARGWVEAR